MEDPSALILKGLAELAENRALQLEKDGQHELATAHLELAMAILTEATGTRRIHRA